MKRRWLTLLLLCGAWDPITSPVPEVEEGNQSFADGKYDEATRHYRTVQPRLGGEPALHFDLGAALHQQARGQPPSEARDGLFDAAEKELRLALDASDPRLRASAHYNLGNTLFERGKYLEAIDEYKKSLKLDPTSEDARHNLELALRFKKEPPPQPQPRPQPKADPQTGPQEPSPPSPSPDGPQGKPEPQPEPPKGDEPGQPGESKETQPTDLTAEDIERKLDELETSSKRLTAARLRDHAAERRRNRPVKDW